MIIEQDWYFNFNLLKGHQYKINVFYCERFFILKPKLEMENQTRENQIRRDKGQVDEERENDGEGNGNRKNLRGENISNPFPTVTKIENEKRTDEEAIKSAIPVIESKNDPELTQILSVLFADIQSEELVKILEKYGWSGTQFSDEIKPEVKPNFISDLLIFLDERKYMKYDNTNNNYKAKYLEETYVNIKTDPRGRLLSMN